MGDKVFKNENENVPSSAMEECKDGTRTLEQTERATVLQEQTRISHRTAFGATTTGHAQAPSISTRPVMEDETSTGPVTPTHYTAGDLERVITVGHEISVSRRSSAPSLSNAELRLLSDQAHKIASTGKPKCAVCSIDFAAANKQQRVKHFNLCWKKFHNAAAERSSERRPLASSHKYILSSGHCCLDAKDVTNPTTPIKICILCNLSLERLSSADAFEHRILCQRELMPTICPHCDTLFATDGTEWGCIQIAQHMYDCSTHPEAETFQTVQHAWSICRLARKDWANCALCLKGLSHLDSIDAYHHRRNCLLRFKPIYCPVCSDLLPTISGVGHSRVEDILWHMHNCQHSKKLSTKDRFNFEALELRWMGRAQGVWSIFDRNYGCATGSRGSWNSKDHQHSYRTKVTEGRNNQTGLYLTPSSRLRNGATYTDDDNIKLTYIIKSKRPVWNNLDFFRRMTYSVYSMPAHGDLVKSMKIEYCIVKIVHRLNKRQSEMFPSDPTTIACI